MSNSSNLPQYFSSSAFCDANSNVSRNLHALWIADSKSGSRWISSGDFERNANASIVIYRKFARKSGSFCFLRTLFLWRNVNRLHWRHVFANIEMNWNEPCDHQYSEKILWIRECRRLKYVQLYTVRQVSLFWFVSPFGKYGDFSCHSAPLRLACVCRIHVGVNVILNAGPRLIACRLTVHIISVHGRRQIFWCCHSSSSSMRADCSNGYHKF